MSTILDQFRLDGKKAIVTGAARGLSLSIAQSLIEAGAEVVLMDINETVHTTAKTLHSTRCHAVQCDLGDYEAIRQSFDQALAQLFGRLDILVNGAGVQYRCPSKDFPKEQWDIVLNIDLSSVFFMCQHAGRVMLLQNSGRIINIASMNAFFGGTIVPAYAASKGGVAHLTKALSNEWAPHGITVNAIAPGYMVSEMSKTMRDVPGQIEELTKRIPVGRWGEGKDLQGLSVFLASSAASYITGAIIPVDGGFMCR